MEKQITENAAESLNKLNKNCSFGCKKTVKGSCPKTEVLGQPQGNIFFWKGYKLHLDVSDTGFPITACVTGANVHDSMLAVIMKKMTEQRVAFCYSLMDSAYDAQTNP